MSKLQTIVEDSDTLGGRVFDLSIQFLVVLSLITFSLETLPDLSLRARTILRTIEMITVAIFTVEYLVRLWVADSRLRFATSFFGVVDLLAILPFYVSTGVNLQSIRVLRLIRLFRILKLARYSNAARRFQRAMVIAREEIVLFLSVTVILLYLGAVGIYYFENEVQPKIFASVFHSLWWAVATLTTVGYGDIYPVTVGGRIFTFVILLIGLGIVAVPAGLVSSALAQARKLEDAELEVPHRKEG